MGLGSVINYFTKVSARLTCVGRSLNLVKLWDQVFLAVSGTGRLCHLLVHDIP